MDVLFFSTIADQIKKEINHKCGLNISQTRILLYFDETHNQALAMGKLAEALNISLSTLSRQLLAEIEKSLFVYLDQDASTLFIKQLNEIAQTSASLEKTE